VLSAILSVLRCSLLPKVAVVRSQRSAVVVFLPMFEVKKENHGVAFVLMLFRRKGVLEG
jgi:hypothetical protein